MIMYLKNRLLKTLMMLMVVSKCFQKGADTKELLMNILNTYVLVMIN